MNKLRDGDFKVLIEYKGYINVDQILNILDSIDFIYRVLYRYKFKLAYNYPLAIDRKLRLSNISSGKSFEFLFQSDIYSKVEVFVILFGIIGFLKRIAIFRKTWHSGSLSKWKAKNEKIRFEEKVKELAKEESILSTFPDEELQRFINALINIYYTLDSTNIVIFKLNDDEIYKQEDSSEEEDKN
jgi:hypothetical protein